MVPDIAVIVNPLLAVGDKSAQRADGDGFARFGDDHHEAFAVHRHKGLRRERMLFQQEKVIGRSQGSARLMLASTRLPSDTSILARS